MKAWGAYSRLPASCDDFKLEIISLQTGKEINADYKQILHTCPYRLNYQSKPQYPYTQLEQVPHFIASIRVFIKVFIHTVHTSPQT